MSANGPFQRKLRALEYPTPDSLLSPAAYSSLTSGAFRTLVVWLELTKIRFYPIEARGPLTQIEHPNWNKTFIQYLDDLECTRPYSLEGMTSEQIVIVLDWLLTQAIGAEYSDHAGEYNSLSKMWFINDENTPTTAATSSSTISSSTTTLDCTSPQVLASFESEVASLAQLFRLPFDRTQLASILRIVRKRVEECILAAAAQNQTLGSANRSAAPAAAAGSKGKQLSTSSSTSSTAATPAPAKSTRFIHTVDTPPLPTTREEVFTILDRMELGFPSTDDTLVDHAAQVFRLLFLHDLRSTQNLANELMMLAQEYTSDPKTDAKLGKVGV